MGYFDTRPLAFRLLLLGGTAALLSIAAVSIYNFGSIPTDENLFMGTPGRLSVLRTIPADPVTKSRPVSAIEPGDIITAIDSITFTSDEAGARYASFRRADSHLVDFQRPRTRSRYRARVAAEHLDSSFVAEIPSSAHVFYVAPGGASDRAGIQVGDIIYRINGTGFSNVQEADVLMRRGQAGKSLKYDILRDNKPIVVHVTLAAFGISFSFITTVAAGLLYVAFGLFLGLARPSRLAARLLAILFVGLGFAIMTVLAQREPDRSTFTIARNLLVTAGFVFWPILLLHISHIFPVPRPELRQRPWILWIGYGMAVAATVMSALFSERTSVFAVGGTLAYSAIIHLAFWRRRPPEAVRIMRPVRIATAASFVLAIGVYVIELVLRGGILQGAGSGGYASIALTLVPLSFLYVIGKNRLLDLTLRVRRSFQYDAMATVWKFATIVAGVWLLLVLARWSPDVPGVRITGTSLEVLDAPTDEQRQTTQRALLMVAALAAGTGAWLLGKGGLRRLDRVYHRSRYDYRRAAAELADVMATKLSMRELARGMVEKLSPLMQIKRAGILFFRDQKACCCEEAHGFDGERWGEFCVHMERDLTASLKAFSGPTPVGALPQTIREEFERTEFHVVVPISSKDRLIGAILVGEKRSEAAFQQEDLEFLTATARQASVAIENAFLYEELAEQERLKHELSIARKIQLDSLPQSIPAVPGLDIAGTSVPAQEVGGDYFDYLSGTTHTFTVIVGDVSGKGTSAALYMAKVQGIMRSLHTFGLGPREMLARANMLLLGDIEKKAFVTAIGATFDTSSRVVTLARAGHLPLFVFRGATGTIERIVPRGMGLGLMADDSFLQELEQRRLAYEPGDVFVFVTDGITEARRSNGDLYGEGRLEDVMRSAAGGSSSALRDAILASVGEFVAEEKQLDDKTVVIVRAV